MTDNDTSSTSTKLNSKKVKFFLDFEPKKYQVSKNESASPSIDWWSTFGYPVKSDENGVFRRISGFISCFNCHTTFIYNNNSGTTRFKQHSTRCSKTTRSSITIGDNGLPTQQSILASHGFKKTVKINEKDIDNMKRLSAQWLCQDLRPFSTLEDVGFRAIAQELVNIGNTYGSINVDDILRSRYTIQRTICDLAESCRQHMKQLLAEPLKARAVTICPDFWTDRYKNISYLGLNIIFVDSDYKIFSIDLFCRPFFGAKTSTAVIQIIKEHLIEFGIDSLELVNIVSDRGSNFVAAFRDYQPLFCVAHRLNNVVKPAFFGNSVPKRKPANQLTTTNNISLGCNTTKAEAGTSSVDVDISTSEQSSEEDDDMAPSIPTKYKGRKSNTGSSNNVQLTRKMSIHEIPIEAYSIILVLKQCKKVVKYIKKSGLNKEIENFGGGTVHQSITVRWVSVIESLESILKSYKIIKKILMNKQQQKLMSNINEKTIKQIILLLKPFKYVIKLIQTGNSPSLYMVLLSIQSLKDTMSSYEALLHYSIADVDRQSREASPILDDDLTEELQGINFFWNRIRCLLNEMFTLDIRHYASTALHPKYRSLNFCSSKERLECYEYIRKQIKLIYIDANETNQQPSDKPVQKKFKKDLFSRFESTNFGCDKSDASDEDIETASHGKKTDELQRYLNLEIDKSSLPSDPLLFWRQQQHKFPRLSRYARSIHSIPATAASVERQFSGAGLIINERRTNLKPEQLDNVLLIRSMQRNKILV